jgi:flagellar protein FliO/FliZ
MNTFTHKPLAALLLLGSLLCSLPGDVSAASASASAGDAASSAKSSTVAASAVTNGASANASATALASASATALTSASATASASPPRPAIGNVGNPSGMHPVTSAPTSGVSSVLQVMSALILVVIIMLGLAWGLKNFGPKRLLGRVPVQVVGAANLGGRERVLVIEVADQWIVIGATPNSITTLATLPRQTLNDEELQPGKPFSDWLKQIMEKRNG